MANEKPPETAKAKTSSLVKMTRATPQRPGGPVTADVNPAEVRNYEAGGWNIAKEQK